MKTSSKLQRLFIPIYALGLQLIATKELSRKILVYSHLFMLHSRLTVWHPLSMDPKSTDIPWQRQTIFENATVGISCNRKIEIRNRKMMMNIWSGVTIHAWHTIKAILVELTHIIIYFWILKDRERWEQDRGISYPWVTIRVWHEVVVPLVAIPEQTRTSLCTVCTHCGFESTTELQNNWRNSTEIGTERKCTKKQEGYDNLVIDSDK